MNFRNQWAEKLQDDPASLLSRKLLALPHHKFQKTRFVFRGQRCHDTVMLSVLFFGDDNFSSDFGSTHFCNIVPDKKNPCIPFSN